MNAKRTFTKEEKHSILKEDGGKKKIPVQIGLLTSGPGLQSLVTKRKASFQ